MHVAQISKWFSPASLKYYFNVSNDYVLRKLALIMFPFRHKVLKGRNSAGYIWAFVFLVVAEDFKKV